MSATITQTVSRPNHLPSRLLDDYDLHHSGKAQKNTEETTPQGGLSAEPPHWDVPHRRVPAYRPIDTERDQSQIRVYTHPAERVFIATMFTGVFVNATAAKAWRASFGRLNENIFKYKIGGEI
ncbi:hypothetical protein D7B24_006289 [Verticillium nonalfalfae]|uniref:Uncharacterized protein n=1 Tax=Verticillium nonalfalfae TaxID=1051616 RepID=A0A3M9YAD2_9PEZI|nr:uncharacterized protein D7B24_006289 [Verticillium nonalfalfae]RNJ57251.1 hypothetical protein D7B24_006289 [Verticillium nonalfalfae]